MAIVLTAPPFRWITPPAVAVSPLGGVAAGVRRVEAIQHLMRDLRVAGFIGSHQAQARAARKRGLAIDQKEDCKAKKDCCLADGGPTGQPSVPTLRRIRSGWFLNSFHFQCFSNGAVTQTGNPRSGQGDGGS